jgi:hypothetical protein
MSTTVVATQANATFDINLEDAPYTTTTALGDVGSREYAVQPFLMKVGVYERGGLHVGFSCYRVKKDGTRGLSTVEIYRRSLGAPPLPDWAQVIVEKVQALRMEMLTMYTTAGDEQ